MFHDIETFVAIAKGVQSCAIAIAVVIGGMWTAWVFWLQRRTAVGIEIHVTQLEMSTEERPIILISVTITNLGTRATRLVWEREPVSIAKMTVPVKGSPSLQFVSKASICFMSVTGDVKIERSTGLRAGDRKTYEVVMSVDSPGLYQATFMARAEREHIAFRQKAIGTIEWKALGYVVVK